MTEDVIRLSARTVHPQLHRAGSYSRVAVHKSLITKMNGHLRVQWCKKYSHWSTKSGAFLCFGGQYLVPESLSVQSDNDHGRVGEEALVVE